MKKTIFALIIIVFWSSGALFASDPEISSSDWPNFRGVGHDGIYTGNDFDPRKLSGDSVLWKKNIGEGYSAPTIFRDKLFILGHEAPNDVIRCLDSKTGEEIWSFKYRTRTGSEYPGSRSSPAYSDGKVYTLGRGGDLYCLDADNGAEIWSTNVSSLGSRNPEWDYAGSVLITGDLAVVNAAESGIAFNRNTGEVVWKSRSGTGSYATPVQFSFRGTEYLAIFSSRHLYAVELATGRELWSIDWVNRSLVNSSDPLIFDDKVLISTGYSRGCALFDFSGGAPTEIWRNRNLNSQVHSSIYYKGMIFGVNGDAGNSRTAAFRCIDPDNGQVVWEKRLGYAGFILAGDNFILCNESGRVYIFEASTATYKEIASAEFDRGQYWTAPVMSSGRLYLRSVQGLLSCIDLSD